MECDGAYNNSGHRVRGALAGVECGPARLDRRAHSHARFCRGHHGSVQVVSGLLQGAGSGSRSHPKPLLHGSGQALSRSATKTFYLLIRIFDR